MNQSLLDAQQALEQARNDFAEGRLSPVAYRDVREPALSRALVALAEGLGVNLQQPLHVDSNGEFSIVALHPNGQSPRLGCGSYGEELAALLTLYRARTGIASGVLCAENGWCRLNHMQAEKMVRSYVP